jgi:hypothetical protein
MKPLLTPEETAEIKTLADRAKTKNAPPAELGRYNYLLHGEFARTMQLLAKPDGTLTDSEIKLLRREALVKGQRWYALVNNDDGNWKAFDAEWLEKAKSGWPTNKDLLNAYLTKTRKASEEDQQMIITDEEVAHLSMLVAKSEESEEALIAMIGFHEYLEQEKVKRIKSKEAAVAPELEELQNRVLALRADNKNDEANKLIDDIRKTFPFASKSQRADFGFWCIGLRLKDSNKAQGAYLEALQKAYDARKNLLEAEKKRASVTASMRPKKRTWVDSFEDYLLKKTSEFIHRHDKRDNKQNPK